MACSFFFFIFEHNVNIRPLIIIFIGGLTILFHVYRQVLPTLDGYLIENSNLNLARCQKFFAALVPHERVGVLVPFLKPANQQTNIILSSRSGLLPRRECQCQVDEAKEGRIYNPEYGLSFPHTLLFPLV